MPGLSLADQYAAVGLASAKVVSDLMHSCRVGDGYTLDFLRDETEKAEVRDRVNTHQRILIEAL